MISRHIKFILFIFFCISISWSKDEEIEKRIQFQTQKFKFILETLYKNYADSINIEEISDAGFKAMLQHLDEQSIYYNKEQRDKFKASIQGSKIGIGIKVQFINDTLTIVGIVEQSPADSIGLKIGDKILFLNGVNTTTASKSDISDILNGDEGDEIHIIYREFFSGKLEEKKFTLRSYHIPSISANFRIQNTDYWYIDIDNFSQTIVEDFEKISAQLQNAKGLIFDLRGNPGGYLERVCKFIDNFFPAGLIIAYTEARNPDFKVSYKTETNGKFSKIPIIVVIDKSSASASEIFAAVMQDYDRGLVVGEQSFGKGSVQKLWELTDGTAFRATVAKYFTPLGRMLQKTSQTKFSNIEIDPSISLLGGKEAEKQIKDLISKTGGKTQLPIYRTPKGRIYIGLGAIMPDYIVARDTTTPLIGALNQKGIFLLWALEYLKRNYENIKSKYGEKFNKFASEWNLNDEDIDLFINLAKANGIWNEEMYQKDKNLIVDLLKASVANVLWGNNGMKAVTIKFDKPVLRAIELMKEAQELIVN